MVSWAMVGHPDVLLFDEPTASVDLGFSETIYAIMHRLSETRRTTILFVSHDMNVVSRHASKVLCINRRLACQGPPQEVLTPASLQLVFGDVALYHHEDASQEEP
ncbi:Zinc import ATP-binding protein ZnuC [compost metagenome]